MVEGDSLTCRGLNRATRTGYYWFAWFGTIVLVVPSLINDPLHAYSRYADAPEDAFADGLSFWLIVAMFLLTFLFLGLVPRYRRTGDHLYIVNPFLRYEIPIDRVSAVRSSFGHAQLELDTKQRVFILAVEQYAAADIDLGLDVARAETGGSRGERLIARLRSPRWEDGVVLGIVLGYPLLAGLVNWPELGF